VTDSIKSGLLQTAIAEIGAVGLGSILYVTLLDVTGLLSASAVAVTGFAILPYRRAKLITNLQVHVEEIRNKMNVTLQTHFKQHLEDGIIKMKDNMSPYTHFINKEYADIGNLTNQLNQVDADVKILHKEINEAFNKNV